MRRWLRVAPFAVVLVVVGWLMLTPKPPDLTLPPWLAWDKLLHALAWLCLALPAWRLPWPPAWARRSRASWTWGLIAAYGGLLEVAQHFLVPGRTGELADWLADSLGGTVGVSLAWALEAWHDKRTSTAAPGSAEGQGDLLQGVGSGGRIADALEQPGSGGR